jgi:hypothetical protein
MLVTKDLRHQQAKAKGLDWGNISLVEVVERQDAIGWRQHSQAAAVRAGRSDGGQLAGPTPAGAGAGRLGWHVPYHITWSHEHAELDWWDGRCVLMSRLGECGEVGRSGWKKVL